MSKIKILFYSHSIDYGGTWRSHERVLVNLNKNLFDPYVFINPNQNNNRLDYLKTKIPDSNFIKFNASKEKTGPEKGYSYIKTDFIEKAKEIKFDIIHFARAGYYEWPFVERIAPVQIETNIFGARDNSPFLDCSVAISDTIFMLRRGANYRIYNPVPLPYDNKDDLREFLNIDDDNYVFGRVGRPDNFHDIALKSLVKMKKNGIKFKYLILGPCDQTINTIKEFDLMNDCVLFEPTNDDNFIHKFYNTIDLFLHYRIDGESFGVAIAHSMMYGVPVVSHYAGYNAQKEIIQNGGYVANNVDDYTEFSTKILEDKNMYDQFSKNARKRAEDFEETKITKEWEKLYLGLIKKT